MCVGWARWALLVPLLAEAALAGDRLHRRPRRARPSVVRAPPVLAAASVAASTLTESPAPEPASLAPVSELPVEGMPPGEVLRLNIPHGLEREEARVRVTQMFDYFHQDFRMEARWVGFQAVLTGSLYGVPVDARFEVKDGEVVAVARDPGFPWSGPAYDYTRRLLKKYLHPTYQEP